LIIKLPRRVDTRLFITAGVKNRNF